MAWVSSSPGSSSGTSSCTSGPVSTAVGSGGASSAGLPEAALPYLERLEIAHKVSVKDGLFTTTDLSTGQRKRLALVHAYLEGRPVLVFDDLFTDPFVETFAMFLLRQDYRPRPSFDNELSAAMTAVATVEQPLVSLAPVAQTGCAQVPSLLLGGGMPPAV